MEYGKGQIPFLEIFKNKNKNSIWMDINHKPTNTQRCLPFTSSHPNHCNQNIPFCLTQKICTIADLHLRKPMKKTYKKTYKNLRSPQMKISCHLFTISKSMW